MLVVRDDEQPLEPIFAPAVEGFHTLLLAGGAGSEGAGVLEALDDEPICDSERLSDVPASHDPPAS